MSNDIRMDLTEVVTLARVVGGAQSRCMAAIKPAVTRGANNVKRDAKQAIESSTRGFYTELYPRSISYDVFTGPVRVVAEIGPDKDRPQGALGNLLEFGSSNNAPLPHLMPAGEKEAPRFEAQVASAALRAMLR